MEEIKDRLGEYKYNFFVNFQNYLDTELIFYGSIKRADYFQKSSDVDITIITENVSSMISKIRNYLHIDKSQIKKIYQKFTENSHTVVSGYKIKYKDSKNNVVFDILVYDEKYMEPVMKNINDINTLPMYMVIILCILKVFYYNLNLIPRDIFLYLKNFIFYTYFNKKIDIYNKNTSTTIVLDDF